MSDLVGGQHDQFNVVFGHPVDYVYQRSSGDN